MKKSNLLKFMIFLVLIIVIILVIILFYIIKGSKNQEIVTEANNVEEKNVVIEENTNNKFAINKEDDSDKFFSIDNYINDLVEAISKGEDEKVKSILSSENIKDENNQQVISSNITQWYSQNIYRVNGNIDYVYFIEGIAKYLDDNKEVEYKEMYCVLTIDKNNKVMDINFITQTEYNQKINSSIISIEERNIESNEYNSFSVTKQTSEQLFQKYFDDFIMKTDYDIEVAYELVDEMYRIIKFDDDIEKFKQYLQENESTLKNVNIKQCEAEIDNELYYNRYTGIDNYGNHYVIYIGGILEYVILLDDATVERQ